jgi:hypothetical protein
VFADPVSDLAVLGAPHSDVPGEHGALGEETDRYEAFTASLPPFAVTPPARRGLWRTRDSDGATYFNRGAEAPAPAYVLSLAGEWQECKVSHRGGALLIEPTNLIKFGMSGSAVISATGAALGVIGTGAGTCGGIAACLTNSLPAWILRALESKTA